MNVVRTLLIGGASALLILGTGCGSDGSTSSSDASSSTTGATGSGGSGSGSATSAGTSGGEGTGSGTGGATAGAASTGGDTGAVLTVEEACALTGIACSYSGEGVNFTMCQELINPDLGMDEDTFRADCAEKDKGTVLEGGCPEGDDHYGACLMEAAGVVFVQHHYYQPGADIIDAILPMLKGMIDPCVDAGTFCPGTVPLP